MHDISWYCIVFCICKDKIQIGHTYAQDSVFQYSVMIWYHMLHPGFLVPPLPVFLLFLKWNLFSVLVPSMCVRQLSGIPFRIPFVTPKPFLRSNDISNTHSSGQPLTSPTSEALNAPDSLLTLVLYKVIGPIPWGHSGPLYHALSLSSSSLSSWTSMCRRRATVPLATSAEWAWGGSLWRMDSLFFKCFLLLTYLVSFARMQLL